MAPGDVGKGHDRPQGDARPGVVAAHDAGAVVTHRIQAVDDLPVGRQHFTGHTGAQPVESAQIAHDDFHGKVRSLANRRYARVGLLLRVGQVAIEAGAAAAELTVFTVDSAKVVLAHSLLQPLRIDTGLAGQLRQGLALEQVTVAQQWPQRHRRRLGKAQPVFGQCAAVAHQPHGGFCLVGTRLDQRCAYVVVGIRLVGESLPRTQHADHTRLVAVEQMRKGNMPPTTHRHLRHRHPSCRCLQADIDLCSQRLGHARTIAGVTRWHR
ncbi:hypothetical protein D9M71_464040 [compost metagenome]